MSTTSTRQAIVRRRRPVVGAVAVAMLAGLAHPSVSEAMTVGPGYRIGHWDPAFSESGAGVPSASASAALPDGRVFYYQGLESGPAPTGGAGAARVLDPRPGTPVWTVPSRLGTDGYQLPEGSEGLQCGDLAQLPDGQLLVAGGGSGDGPDDAGTYLLDAGGGTLRRAAPMNTQRWHASLVTLADGRVLVAGGTSPVQSAPPTRPVSAGTETYDPTSNVWTVTGSASQTSLPSAPRLFVIPGGKVFYSGAGESRGPDDGAGAALWGSQQSFDPATGQWSTVALPPGGFRHGATSVMLTLEPPYDEATVLTFGGAAGTTGAGATPVSTLATASRSGDVVNRTTGSTNYARSFSSAVLLPDGTVLALAGAGPAGLPLQEAELFVPGYPAEGLSEAHGRWFRVADPVRPRGYHHSGVLLPDGRVLLGGGDGDTSLEVFTPPYLYRVGHQQRPVITRAPAVLGWGETVTIGTGQALSVDSVVLMRLGSPQHMSDSDARMVRLPFRRANGRELQVTAPPDGGVAPPGLYYLFVNKETPKGPVPSVARIVRVGPGL